MLALTSFTVIGIKPNHQLYNKSLIWSTYTVDSLGNVGEYSSLAIDKDNGIHISYLDSTNGDKLKYACKPSNGSWSNYTIEYIGHQAPYETHTSIAVDSFKGVHICYWYGNGTLKYAYKPFNGTWSNYTLDRPCTIIGQGVSIAVDNNNGVHIAYYDHLNYNLKYAYKPYNGTWSNCTVDSIGEVGLSPSIAVYALPISDRIKF